MRHTLFSKVLALMLTLLVLMPNMGLTVLAADTVESVSKSKTSSEYELTKDNDTTEITLSLPSDEYLDTFDIVFVVDASNESAVIEAEASDLMGSILDTDLNVNIGVIKFKGKPQDTINTVSNKLYSGLTPLSDETRSFIQEAIDFDPDTDARSTTGHGTNIHSALLVAQKWLDESSTPDEQKYVLLFTDGRAYIYDDGEGNPTCIYTQYHRAGVTSNRIMYDGEPTISSNAEGDKYHSDFTGVKYIIKDDALDQEFRSRLVKFFPDSNGNGTIYSNKDYDALASAFNNLYNSDNKDLTETTYDRSCIYVDSGTAKDPTLGTAEIHTGVDGWSTYFSNDATLFKDYYEVIMEDEDDKAYFELSPLEVDFNEETEKYYYTGKLNDNYWMFHVSSAEKALYLTAHTWADLDKNYNSIAIINDRGFNSGLEACMCFLGWVLENSDLSASVKDTTAVSKVFSQLENELIYAVGRAVVTDEIPDYLDLVEDNYNGVPFQLTLDGEALTVTEISDNEWGFGSAVSEDLYPYRIFWNADERTFVFFINVPVENAHPLKLIYALKWNGTGDEDIDVDTNASTIIEYWASNSDSEEPDGTEPYVSPVVIYRSTVDYTVTKEWNDADNQDGKRTDSVTVQLYADGEALGDPVTLDESNKWSHTWSDLFKKEDGELIDYSVKETTVPQGYESNVEEDSSGYSAIITNNHDPEIVGNVITVTKKWDDADNQDGKRPSSIKVDLLANGKSIKTVELSEKNKWTGTFESEEGFPAYSGGKEIIYTVSEPGLDVQIYKPSVAGSVKDSFTITNTHKPESFVLFIAKLWDDEEDKDGVRPESVTINLLADGEIIDTTELGDFNMWTASYELPVYADGKEIEYTVTEEPVEGYEKPVIVFDPDYSVYLVTNTHKVTEPPKTDDATNQRFWVGMMVSSMALIAVIFYLKRRQDEE